MTVLLDREGDARVVTFIAADCLSALIALSPGCSVERLGVQLGHSIPPLRREGHTAQLPDSAQAATSCAG